MDCEYVVGEFALDNDISEIPSNWLTTDDDGFLETWWPPSGENIPKLIKERTPPSEDSWETYRIDILAKCDTYVEARAKGKKLSDQSQCDTSDPDNRGRGRRQKKGKKHFDELYDGETLDSDGENENQIEKEKSAKPGREVSVSPKKARPEMPTMSGELNVIMNTNNPTREGSTARNACTDNVEDNRGRNVEHPNVNVRDGTRDDDIAEKSRRKIRRLDCQNKILFKRVQQLEHNVEDAKRYTLIKPYRHLKDIEKANDFSRELAKDSVMRTHFANYVHKIGGRTKKEHVRNVLQKLFDRRFATKCNYTGMKNKFPVGEQYFMQKLKVYICKDSATYSRSDCQDDMQDFFAYAPQSLRRWEAAQLKKRPNGYEGVDSQMDTDTEDEL